MQEQERNSVLQWSTNPSALFAVFVRGTGANMSIVKGTFLGEPG
jgi:hypothetical protein